MFISASERAKLLNPLPQLNGGGEVSAELVEFFVERWNNTQYYWSLGITSVEDLPVGYDMNFIPHDKYLSRW